MISLNLDLLYNYLIYSLNILRFVAFIRHEICVACEASPDQKLANVSQPVHFVQCVADPDDFCPDPDPN